MTTTKTFASKLTVAFVAAAMIVSAFAPAAQAQTSEDLQQMINDLLAQVAGLQSQVGQGATNVASGVCPYTWTRDLTMGSEGNDVMKLQQFLNADPDTRVAAAGAGSVGAETMYYGPATAAAVSKMQVKYRAQVLAPANLVNPTGFFGPSSRSAANGLCVAAPVVVDNDDDEATEEEEEEDDNGSMSLSGEGTLTTFEIDDDEDTISEGDEDVVVMVLTMEAEDGDIEVSRLGFTLTADNVGTTNEEQEPWDTFTEVSLWVDGDKIASFEADDEDEYLDDDAGEESFRFSNIDLILEEDVEVEVLVAVSVMNSVDGSDASDAAKWNIEPNSVRYFDADGVASTEDNVGEMTPGVDAGEQETFDIEEEGTDDAADIESSSNNPDEATLLVDEDSDESDEFTVHIFDIDVDNDSGDLELGDAFVTVTVGDITGGAGIAGGQRDVIDEIFMTIDGETVEGDASGNVSGALVLEGAAIVGAGSSAVEYVFEFDEDVVLEGDEEYQVEISIVFKGQDSNFVNGVSIETSVDGAGAGDGSRWEAEGSEDDDNITGTDSSETHRLATVVPVISDVEVTSTVDDPNDSGTISFEFTIEADGDNDIVGFTVADVITTLASTAGTPLTPTGGLSELAGDANETAAGVWTISDGDEATFALDFTYTTVAAGNDGTYRVTLESILGVEVDETSAGLNLSN